MELITVGKNVGHHPVDIVQPVFRLVPSLLNHKCISNLSLFLLLLPLIKVNS